MVAGTGLLVWHVGAVWTWIVLAISIVLLFAVVASGAAARRVAHGMARLESWLARAVTWLLLGAVFVCLFIPGRFVLRLSGDSRLARKRQASTWRRLDERPKAGRFEVPY